MIDLSSLSTRAPSGFNKKHTKSEMKVYADKIGDLQNLLYAQSQFSLLIILQGLDASGKDGLIKSVFRGINPLGVTVKSFKAPSQEEQSFDFLWRVHKQVPAKGNIGIFNRSHYEDVLVPRVDNWVDKKDLEKRFYHINNFEKLLMDTGTTVLKFYLHVSHEEQHERLVERKTVPRKFWKHSDGDWETRKKWDDYMEAYQDVFTHCNDPSWNIIPSDQNWYKEYLVAKKIKETLESLPLEYPELETDGVP